MGKRGPGAKRLREAASRAEVITAHPWEHEGMPPELQVITFLETLPIVSGLKAGEMLELLESQKDFVHAVYGDLDDQGRRNIRLAVLSEARGNGKTGLLAGLSLAHLLGPMSEPYGECYAAALDREQAAVMYRMCRAFIEATPWMAARVNCRDWHKQIIDEETNSLWCALTSDARKAHGLAPSFWVADEVAQWKSRELYDNLNTGMGKRKQALGVTISTQAQDDIHFFSEMLDAEPDPHTYVQLHTAPAGCELGDREAWKAANPALGAFLDLKEFEIAADKAIKQASYEPSFRLLRLNQRVAGEVRFINPADWEANAESFDLLELEGKQCFGGLDLSSTKDLTALALYFPENGEVLVWHWVPEETIALREERDRVPYRRWAADGWIETTPGKATDRDAIARTVADIRSRYDVQAIAYDKWRFEDLAKTLSDQGIDTLPMEAFIPGFKTYTPAVDQFETAILQGRFRHNNNPVLTWQASNLIMELDSAGNRKPAKNKSIDKIDGLVAAIMAMGLWGGREPVGEFFFEAV